MDYQIFLKIDLVFRIGLRTEARQDRDRGAAAGPCP